jgi:trehalose 6-phosphate synthase/phosphatase
VAAPSRENVGAYREYRRSVDELVGRINGRFTTLGNTPIHYISRTMPRERLAALYRAASVAMITPLRDGMNLVAKEFVATRADEDGVLVLSELAGAAAELSSALLVNPFDLDQVAENLRRALQMPEAERRERMRTLRGRVMAHDVHRWAEDFVRSLTAEHRRAVRLAHHGLGLEDAVRPDEIVAAIGDARRLAIVLDYDGTLVPLVPSPSDARPDEEVIRLLSTLGGLPDIAVHIVSGRRRSELEDWLGGLPIGLHAEHGLTSRLIGRKRWRRRLDAQPAWFSRARPVIAGYARDVPGSHVEEKEAALVWHYRQADPVIAEPAAERLAADLDRALAGTEARIVAGSRIVEVRQAGVDKGVVVETVMAAHPGRRLIVVGDDTTDEDMFAAAPETAITVRVGPGRTAAHYRVGGADQVRALLGLLARRDGAGWPAPEA